MAPAVTVAPQGGPLSTAPLLLVLPVPLLLVLPVPLLLVLPVPLLLVLPVPLLLVLPVPLLLVLPVPLLLVLPLLPVEPLDEPEEELSPKVPAPPGLEEHAATSTTTPAAPKTSDDLSLEIHT
jgi:hypothetical protein